MTASERREAILNTLMLRRKDTASNLAAEFGVSERTIRNDILELMCSFPIDMKQGRYGGGIEVAPWFRMDRRYLAPEQVDLLKRMAPGLEGKDLQVLNSIITQFAAHI